ncbi:uncharacterized protein VP01_7111g1 [Puccinia sorghi]|uniref:Uncharacterized protein n=1 Tax=Puccinia sorghi TaxID=27349 RepID=A0A0L6UDJ4_9BASI|nr:uncharacterized protein VP01_7111g1 [Puccinia sorghi]
MVLGSKMSLVCDYRKVLAVPAPKRGSQSFNLVDCIAMVSDFRTVPMRAMFFLLGIYYKTIDSFFDAPFIGGITLMLWGMHPPSPQSIMQ